MKFRDKFAYDEYTGRIMLTAVGCQDRHNLPRGEQLRTKKEDYNINGNREYYSDNKVNSSAFQLKAMGLIPDPMLELEEWVEKHRELINE